MEYPAALMMAGSPKLRSDSETRRSIVSSGIGPDSSPRSSLSCSEFSPCPSVSSLDDPPDYSPSDEPYDVDSLPEDDASQLSSGGDVEELNANTTTDSLTDHTPNHTLTIRGSHGLPHPPRLAENFKRTKSMNIDALPWATRQDTKDVRSMSMDERYETPSPKPSFRPWNDNVTVIKINPGYEPEIFPSLNFDNRSLPCLNEDEIKPNNREFCFGNFPNNNTNAPNFNYASDENRNVEVDMDKVRVASYLNLASQNNKESSPGYIKFIDDQTTDATSSSADDTSLDIDKVKVNVIANPVYESCVNGGVKFLDQQLGANDRDSICSSVECSEEEEYKRKSKAPDGGWGWVIVAASFVISMIADGISFSFGLLYIEFLQHFGESSSQTSLVGSLFMAVPLLSGPIGSALVDRYGCRIMTMIGGFVAGLGFVASAFANSLEMMYITFGLVAGVGLGLCYVTAVVSIAYWFDRRRTLATGLGACGTGFGTVLFAHLTSYFISEYGWRGCTLLLAGTFFNMCVCGALMRDPEWWAEQNKAASVAGTKSMRGASSCGSVSGLVEDFPGVEELKRRLRCGEESEYTVNNLATSTGGDAKGNGGDVNQNYTFRSVVNLPTFVRQSEKVPLEVLESLSANRRVFNVILENYPTLLLSRSASDGSKLNATPRNETAPLRVPVTMSMRVTQSTRATPPMESSTPVSPDMSITPLIRQSSLTSQDQQTGGLQYGSIVPWREDKLSTMIEDAVPPPPPRREHKLGMFGCVMPKTPPQKEKSILHKKHIERADSLQALKKHVSTVPSTHYLKNIRLHRNSVMYRGAMLNIHRYRLRASSCPDIYRNSMTTIAKENQEKWYADMLDLFRGMVDFSMFQELHFLLMSIATILLFIWFIVPYFYLADHALLNNYSDREVSSLLMIIGVTNFFGMVGLGWAGDQPWMNVTKTYAMCMVICGLATMAMPYFTYSYWLLASSCACFGLFFASSFSFTPVILAQLIPIERFTTAYGLSLMCQGIGNLMGPPLAGWFFDVTRTYDMSFYMAGVWIIVAGILLAIIPMTTNRRIWGNGPIEKDKASLSDNRDSYT